MAIRVSDLMCAMDQDSFLRQQEDHSATIKMLTEYMKNPLQAFLIYLSFCIRSNIIP